MHADAQQSQMLHHSSSSGGGGGGRNTLEEFYSPEAIRQREDYTRNAVAMLKASKEFKGYRRHVNMVETLQYTWVLGPLGLFFLAYIEFIAWLTTSQHKDGLRGMIGALPMLLNAPFRSLVVGIAAFWIFPWCWLAPWTGFFKWIEPKDARHTALSYISTCVFMILFGGKLYEYPPIIIPYSAWSLRMFTMLDFPAVEELCIEGSIQIVSLLGPLVGGTLFYHWHSQHWRNIGHLPFPLFTIPPALTLFSLGWMIAINFLFASREEQTVIEHFGFDVYSSRSVWSAGVLLTWTFFAFHCVGTPLVRFIFRILTSILPSSSTMRALFQMCIIITIVCMYTTGVLSLGMTGMAAFIWLPTIAR